MRCRIVFSLAALLLASVALEVFSPPAQALSEYGFLLENKPLGFSYYSLYPKSCSGFSKANLSLASNARGDFAFSKASQALNDLRKAKAHALLQPTFLTIGTLAAYRQYSSLCFAYGQKALKESVEAAKEGLSIIDGHSAKLEKMIGPEFQGFAGGIISELGEAKYAIEKRNSSGKGFGSQFVKTIQIVNFTPSSRAIAAAVQALVGKASLLESEVSLDDRVSQAIFLLEREMETLREQNGLLKIQVKSLKDALQAEKIRGIGEDAFYLVGKAEAISAEYDLESFEQDFRKADEDEKTASEKLSQAEADLKKADAGYASRAIEKMRGANALLQGAQETLGAMAERSQALESGLKKRLLQEKASVEQMMQNANAFAAANARSLLAKGLQPSALATRGERILFYLQKITEMQDLQAILGETVGESELKDRVKAKAGVLRELVERALRDAPLEFEQNRLGEIEASLATASIEEYPFFNGQLDELHSSAIAMLYGKYSALGEKYGKALSLSPFLGEAQQQKVLQLQGFFETGDINVEDAAGSLRKIGGTLDEIISQAEAKIPAILQKHLLDQASVEKQFDTPTVGEETTVRHKITFRNLLPLSTPKQIELNVQVPPTAGITQKGEGMTIGAKSVFLSGVAEGGEYSVEFETLEKIAGIKKSQLKVVSADLLEANAEEKIVFTSTEDTEVLLLLNRPFPLEYAEADSGKTMFFSGESSSEIRALVSAAKGENQVSFNYAIPNPVALNRSSRTIQNGNESLFEMDFQLESKYAELHGFKASLTEEACEPQSGPAQPTVSGSANAKVSVDGGIMEIIFEEDEFKKLETKEARVFLHCIPQSQFPAGNGLGQVETSSPNAYPDPALAKELWNQVGEIGKACAECVAQAKKQLLLGDLAQAEIELQTARQKAAEKQDSLAAESRAFQTLSQDFEGFRDDTLEAIAEFDKAFTPSEENAWELGKNLLHQQGKKTKGGLEKLLAAGPKAKNSLQLNSTLGQAKAKLESLMQTLTQQREKAQQEIELAEEKQTQFGNAETKGILAKAQDLSSEGMHFTGWTVARDLNKLFKKQEAGQGKGEEGNSIVLGAAGAFVLIALAFFFLRRKPPENTEGSGLGQEGFANGIS